MGIHVDIETLARIAFVRDPVESRCQYASLQEIGIGGTVREAQFETPGLGYADRVSAIITGVCDGAFLPAYIKLKTEEWNAYARHLTRHDARLLKLVPDLCALSQDIAALGVTGHLQRNNLRQYQQIDRRS